MGILRKKGCASLSKAENCLRYAATLGCLLFATATFFMLLSGRRYDRLLLAGATVFLSAAPELAQRLLRCRIRTPFYLFCLFYAIGPMLGHCYNLYYRIPWWDKMLHIFAGLVFAVFGAYLAERCLGEGRRKRLFAAAFAFCLSVAISVVWEFAEFGADRFFSVDMQSDTVVHSILSYRLGEGYGNAGMIEPIVSVVINGEPLPLAGYLDIGLIDTMWDMMLETLGAAAVVAFYLLDKGRHAVVLPLKN